MKNFSLPTKFRPLIIPVVVSVASVAIISLVIVPQILGFLEDQNNLQSAKERQKILEAKASELEGLDEVELNEKIALVNTLLPVDKEITSVVDALQRVTSLSNTILVSLQLGQSPVSKEQGLSGFSISAEVAGPKESVNRLLENIEKAPRIMKITGIEIASARDKTAITANLSIDVYFAPLAGGTPKIDAPVQKLTKEDEDIISRFARIIPKQLTTPTGPEQILTPRGKPNPFE